MIAGAVASEPTWAAAKSAKEINSEVNACLDRFYRQVPGSKELAAQAKGMLVMPKVIKAGLIVGGEYGEGALRIDKKAPATTTSSRVRSGSRSAPKKRTS